jgi:hypothetical protein
MPRILPSLGEFDGATIVESSHKRTGTMTGLARISFEGGARLMPAQNGYDRELVFEEAECAARRYGRAMLELDRLAMMIQMSSPDRIASCTGCGQPLSTMSFDVGDHHLCPRCARKSKR